MGDASHHSRLSREKKLGARGEYEKGRFTNVGDLAMKAVEQAIEAVAAREGLHFHQHPRSAHAQRTAYVRKRFLSLSRDLALLWSTYGDLGYDGLNGRRAKEALEAMERILAVLEKEA